MKSHLGTFIVELFWGAIWISALTSISHMSTQKIVAMHAPTVV